MAKKAETCTRIYIIYVFKMHECVPCWLLFERLRMFEKRVLQKIFGPKTGSKRKLEQIALLGASCL
jgi:hypothetical protein